MDKKLTFDTSDENNEWLRKAAFERRLSKSAFIAQICQAAQGAAGDKDAAATIERIIVGMAAGDITHRQAVDDIGSLVYHARLDQRAHDEAEWAGVNDAS